MIVGKIVSLALTGVILILVLLFLARKKAPVLMLIAGVELLALAGMQVLTWYIDENFMFGVIIMAMVCTVSTVPTFIVYQTDFRNFFMRVSSSRKKIADVSVTDEEIKASIGAIVTACQTMAKSRTGALIIVVRNKIDQYILDSGVKLDALVSAPLLESIFNTKCPMHDGAVIIRGTKILSAGCFLPLTKNQSVQKDLGTRHRAGIGVSEQEGNEIISIIISEENGIISTAINGALRRYLTPERLFDLLYAPYRTANSDNHPKKNKKIFN